MDRIVIVEQEGADSKLEIKSSLGKTSSSRTSESKNSEGNRFIVDSHL